MIYRRLVISLLSTFVLVGCHNDTRPIVTMNYSLEQFQEILVHEMRADHTLSENFTANETNVTWFQTKYVSEDRLKEIVISGQIKGNKATYSIGRSLFNQYFLHYLSLQGMNVNTDLHLQSHTTLPNTLIITFKLNLFSKTKEPTGYYR